MNNKKNVAFGIVVLVVGLVGGYYYFFIPSAAQNLSFNTPDTASGTDITVSDTDISSSTDVDTPAPVDNSSDAQNIPPEKTSDTVSADENAKSAPTIDDISSAETENDSPQSVVPVSATPTVSCSFPTDTSSVPSRQIIFNEIAWMGSVSSSNAEWMEIKNISTSSVDLSGWELLSESGKIKISFSTSDTIPAGGFFLLSRNNSSTGVSYSGDLSNAGEVLVVLDPQCTVSDILDASSGWPAGNNKTKQTLERDDDGIGWHTSVLPGGTPDAENSVIAPANQAGPANNSALLSGDGDADVVSPPAVGTTTTAISTSTPTSTTEPADANSTDATTTSNPTSNITSGHVLIAAVQIAGASSTNDFIKLYNPTASSIDMSGWKLHKRSSTGADYSLKTFPTGSAIAAGQSFIWANSTNGFSEAIGANVSSTETLSADNSAALLDANGVIIDAVAWGTGTGQYGEGPPYPTDPVAGQVLTRQLVNGSMVDTSNNANDFILQ